MSFDPHEVRMAAAQGAMTTLEAFDDDETIVLCEPVCEALHTFSKHLKSHGLAPLTVMQVLVGMAVAIAQLDDDE